MNKYQKAFIERPGYYLMHYNHNHDKLGRFARSNGSGSKRYDSYTPEEKRLMRIGDPEILRLEASRSVAKKKNIYSRRKRMKELNEQLDERAEKALEAGRKEEAEREAERANRQISKKKMDDDFKKLSSKYDDTPRNNNATKLKHDSDGLLSGVIHFGSSKDVQVYINDDSKNGIDTYNKISNDNKFENDIRKDCTEQIYEMYQGWKDWEDTSMVDARINMSKSDIYRNTHCDQLQIEDDFGDGANVVMVYNHKYGPSVYDYQRWLVTYDTKKKRIVESQPW